MEEQKYLTRTGLLSRGWTAGLIGKFLPSPDLIRPNPNYRSAAPMKLYLIERVAEVENSEEFIAARDRLSSRRNGAKKAVETKKAKTMDFVAKTVQFAIPRYSRSKLTKMACDHYNDRNLEWGSFASPSSDKHFLQRIVVNFLRHAVTDYDGHLERISGKVGTNEAYRKIKEMVLDKIAEEYPWLAEECERQKRPQEEMC